MLEIGVAKMAGEIAAAQAHKYSRTTGIRAFALQRRKQLFDFQLLAVAGNRGPYGVFSLHCLLHLLHCHFRPYSKKTYEKEAK